MEFLTFVLFIIGFVLLISGAEFLVRGASSLAMAIGISPLVVGLTVVAFGTSAPELAVTIQSTYAGQADLAVGNIVGSNIANILLVLGLAGLYGVLLVDKQLLRLELPLMVGASVALWLMGLDGTISHLDGIILFAVGITYTTYVIRKSRKQVKADKAAATHEADISVTPPPGTSHFITQIGLVLLGLVMLVLGSRWLIDGAVAVARILGVSELVIGLTIIAVGTSLPEIATSIIASIKNKGDIAVGNAVGSNIFNIVMVLGLGSAVSPAGIVVSPLAIRSDIPIMIAVAIICIPIFYTRYRIDRWEGGVLTLYYVIYTIYLFLSATQNPASAPFTAIITTVVLPITGLFILVSAIRYYYHSRNTSPMMSKTAPPSQN
ncbi:MAG: calcium/sodium antiporter [Anaerolineaceae bacterium]|nr:calcium/sodium antiporter [Anaerolineaceae bacterium]